MALFPQGFKGLGGALSEASPLLLSMANSMRQGQGTTGGLQQGLAGMMEQQRKRQQQELMQNLFGGGQDVSMSSMGGAAQTGYVPPVVDGGGAFPQSLIANESGGRWDAQNNAMGSGGQAGHFGRLQFGKARLEDAMRAGAIPQGTTPEQFMANPQLQQAAERWHFSDIDRQAESRGLNRYLGQNVGGVTVTPDAIRSMAHLGGIGGAERFLESGGQYNPADANGTSLRDYGTRHGGGNVSMSAQNGGGQSPQAARLMQAMASGLLDPAQTQVVGMMLQQEMARSGPIDPLKQIQLQTAQLELEKLRNPNANMPDSVRALDMRARAAGYTPDTPEYQRFMATGGESAAQPNADERAISLLGEIGIPRDQAIRYTQLYTVSRDPITGEAVMLDKSTGQPVQPPAPPAPPGPPNGVIDPNAVVPQIPEPPAPPGPSPQGGMTFPDVGNAFGLVGAGRNIANRVGDVTGLGAPYPETQETQSDFGVLRESLLNDISSGYARQPPSWLLKDIKDLIPAAGSIMTGASGAQAGLRSLQRSMTTELAGMQRVLDTRNLTPTKRIEVEDNIFALSTALSKLDNALGAFGGQSAPTGNTTSTGVTWSIVE